MIYQLYTEQTDIRRELKSFLKNRLYVPTWMAKPMFISYLNPSAYGEPLYIIDRVATAYYENVPVAWAIRVHYNGVLFNSKNTWRFTRKVFRKQGIASRLVSMVENDV